MKKFLFVFLALSVLSGCIQVNDGEVGIKNDAGHIQDYPLMAGWHWINPFVQTIDKWNVKNLEVKETSNVPSSEGLISTLDVSVIFNIPAEKAPFVKKTTGENVQAVLIEPYAREAIRNIVSGYPVSALYSDAGRAEISKKILSFLREKLTERGINIQDVLLRDIKLPEAFSESIVNKMKSDQEAQQKVYELQKAQKDKEIAIVKAEGVAEANNIIGNSLKNNEAYLRYLWIESLKDDESEKIYIPTEAGMPILEARAKAS